MPVPWEALIPFALLTTMFGVGGTLFKTTRTINNDGKTPRYNIDNWEQMMMNRDKRLTGSIRGQSSNPKAPPEFATNSIQSVKKLLV
ncbi:SubName: Full=Related to Hesp-767-Melampsora lini {ECO:0000313/EMBL:CCA66562.1} [Serendipita indica DSM 11827]|uniref:NADH dehydrogenase [ubiquinone] 1 alpha subcomplex subunit 1 n=1 Tax=Serendipita indica (strain DSM 11827) TaxID=1109443 RepID=G4T5G0_SERID|nr:SubName: Full=Related to Hesp-767-Melampsora lini {ECO:0000313/EMBL:CCA66562.1} [Serendipita indica DSM 11827]CCA66562.1 related to Hesp-767-Melampsora lini [Serendipita indica DSM 11827]